MFRYIRCTQPSIVLVKPYLLLSRCVDLIPRLRSNFEKHEKKSHVTGPARRYRYTPKKNNPTFTSFQGALLFLDGKWMYGRPATKGGNSLNKSRKRPSCLFASQIPPSSSIPSAVRKSTNGSLFFGERVGRPGSEIDCCRWLVVAAGIPLPPLAPYPNWNELLPPLLVQSPLTSAHSWCQMSIPKEQDREIFLNAKPRKKSKCLEKVKQGYRIVLCIHSADKKMPPCTFT